MCAMHRIRVRAATRATHAEKAFGTEAIIQLPSLAMQQIFAELRSVKLWLPAGVASRIAQAQVNQVLAARQLKHCLDQVTSGSGIEIGMQYSVLFEDAAPRESTFRNAILGAFVRDDETQLLARQP